MFCQKLAYLCRKKTSYMKTSKTVTIFQSGSFLAVAQGKDVKDFFSGAKKFIGSYYESGGSPRIATGLSFQEETLLLPLILEVPAEHPDFRKTLNDFYRNISTLVPYEHGLTLEIGLSESNTDAVSKSNLPINLIDYLRYRHAIRHPHVAPNKEAAAGNQLKMFYIFDKTEVSKKSSKKLEQQDAALVIYQSVKDDPRKTAMALTLLGVDPNKLDESEHRATLKSKAEQVPDKFIAVLEDKDFETNYWIESMVNHKIIKKMGQKYFDAETDRLLGSSLEEVIYFFRDDSNSDVVVTLKARLQDKTI